MELRDIEYFAVIAEHGHLGRAAESLGLSTAALSKSLRRLEKSVRTKLVRRTLKGVELTVEGSALLSHVSHLRTSIHDIAREVADLSEGRAGHLRVGTSLGISEDLLAGACTNLVQESPKVTLEVIMGTYDTQLPALRKGELDLIFSGVPTVAHEGLVQEHFIDDELVVYASANHRLARHKEPTLADLEGERWVSSSHVILWRRLCQAFEENGLTPPLLAIDTSSTSVRLRVVASSQLLGFSSRLFVRQAVPRYSLVELSVPKLAWSRRLGITYRKDAYLSPAARRFIEILKMTGKEIAKENR